ncbi:MAG: hypothetical protein IT352_18745 [Gemmatimonadales bacterium]|nr:hypothetical protein [Gemmatimonadales bacterium]
MTEILRDWHANRWIVAHQPTIEEISDLLAVADRDLADAAVEGLSPDWRLGIAYNAALQLAILALAATGYRPARERAHERAIQSLGQTVGTPQARVDVIDAVRRKRNQMSYERAGTTSAAEADEMYQAASALRRDVVRWLLAEHTALYRRDRPNRE